MASNSNNNNSQSLFSAAALQLFLTSLSGLPEPEIRKAKELHVRNALVEVQSLIDEHKDFLKGNFFFILIPIFWPFLWSAHRKEKIEIREAIGRISNALIVWQQDIGPVYNTLAAELGRLKGLMQ